MTPRAKHLLLTIFLPWSFLTPVFYNFDDPRGVADREWLGSLLNVVVVSFGALVVGVLVERRMDDQVAAQL